MEDTERNEAKARIINFEQSNDPPILYANLMRVYNTPGEFVLEFGAGTPQSAISVSRLAISPLRIKGMLRAMSESVKKYETSFCLHLPESFDELMSNGLPTTRANRPSGD